MTPTSDDRPDGSLGDHSCEHRSGVAGRAPSRPGHGAPVTAGATFEASRNELLGGHTLLDAAEIARSYCTIADRVVSIVAITPGRIRRVDCWLGGVGFVTHAGAADPSLRVLGSVCDRVRALELTGSVIDALVGGIPESPASAAGELDAVGSIRADAIPGGAEWIVVVSANRTDTGGAPQRLVAARVHGGLAARPLDSLVVPVSIDPASAEELRRHLAEMIGPPPRSVGELLTDD